MIVVGCKCYYKKRNPVEILQTAQEIRRLNIWHFVRPSRKSRTFGLLYHKVDRGLGDTVMDMGARIQRSVGENTGGRKSEVLIDAAEKD